jgi:hypothetical protein
MKFITETIKLAAMIFAVLYVLDVGMSYTITDTEKKILEYCEQGKPVIIAGSLVHCGLISEAVDQKAAKYSSVKNCLNIIGRWHDENNT